MPTTRDELNIVECAEEAHRHHSTIRRWIKSGILPAHRVGPRELRVNRLDLVLAMNRPIR
ncbi:helix-turn-helix domain-containing protein [Microbacterium sp. B2969]|uniref:Helix-turn-helix domain-containing protein n=1 Tax=Microbacterium alkaliflavum TaxID=3248839 RepID=A0ABW7QE69_9MICO